jgi:hypothetical protein
MDILAGAESATPLHYNTISLRGCQLCDNKLAYIHRIAMSRGKKEARRYQHRASEL